MAIINSVFMGRAKKSAGNGTFRTVRGRTIVSQKVAKRGTISGSLSYNQFALAVISRFASVHAEDINASFDTTTYGSSRNAFFKLNYAPMKEAVRKLWSDSLKVGAAKLPSDAEIETAIAEYATANPSSIYRVKKSGQPVQYLTGSWADTTVLLAITKVQWNGQEKKDGAATFQVNDEDTLRLTYTGDVPSDLKVTAVLNSKEDNSGSTITYDFGTTEPENGVMEFIVGGDAPGNYIMSISVNDKKIITFTPNEEEFT